MDPGVSPRTFFNTISIDIPKNHPCLVLEAGILIVSQDGDSDTFRLPALGIMFMSESQLNTLIMMPVLAHGILLDRCWDPRTAPYIGSTLRVAPTLAVRTHLGHKSSTVRLRIARSRSSLYTSGSNVEVVYSVLIIKPQG